MRASPRAALLVFAAVIVGCGGEPPIATPSPAGSPPVVDASPTPAAAPPTGAPATDAPPATPAPLAAGTWARLASDGPTPEAREDHTWTVADDGLTAYLYGGRRGDTVFGDVWAFDLASDGWTRVAISGPEPPARFGHDAAWIPGRGLVVFAGQAGPRFFDDLWLFDPAGRSWTQLPPGAYAPVPRYGSCSGVGPDGRLWISHGFTEDGVRFSDTHAYDFEGGTWTDQFAGSDVPLVRCLHACWWTSEGQFVLYGGQTTGVPALGDLWILQPDAPGRHTWTEAGGQEPPSRQLAAVTRIDRVAVIVGGRGRNGRALEDAWQLVDGSTTLIPLETTGRVPPARSGAALIHDPNAGRLLLFGGLGAAERDDLWALTWP